MERMTFWSVMMKYIPPIILFGNRRNGCIAGRLKHNLSQTKVYARIRKSPTTRLVVTLQQPPYCFLACLVLCTCVYMGLGVCVGLCVYACVCGPVCVCRYMWACVFMRVHVGLCVCWQRSSWSQSLSLQKPDVPNSASQKTRSKILKTSGKMALTYSLNLPSDMPPYVGVDKDTQRKDTVDVLLRNSEDSP